MAEDAALVKGVEGRVLHPATAPRGVRVWRRLRRDRAALAAAIFLLLVAGVAVLAPVLSPHDPYETNLVARLRSPGTPGFPLGTDMLGRDILSRLLYGARVSLLVGFAATGIAVSVGVPVGLVTGYARGRVDGVTMRLVDVLMAFPSILLAIAIIAALGPGLMKAMVAVAIVGIPYYVRIVRGTVLSLREWEFVEAAHALGATHPRVVLRHILPNCLAPIIIAATLDVGFMITTAAGMSFLGLGAQPPTAEWGIMLAEGRQFMRVAPHLAVFPGIAIFLVVLTLNLFGDGLRDALDPRLKV